MCPQAECVEQPPPGLQSAAHKLGRGGSHRTSFTKSWRTRYVFSACAVDHFKILKQKGQAEGDFLDLCHLVFRKQFGHQILPVREACSALRSRSTWALPVRTHFSKEVKAHVRKLSRGPGRISLGSKQAETRWMNWKKLRTTQQEKDGPWASISSGSTAMTQSSADGKT